MKFVTTATLAALLLGSAGVSGLVPAYADAAAAPAVAAPATPAPPADAMAATDQQPGRPGMGSHMRGGDMGMGRPGAMRGGLLSIACGDRGAEALEIAFIHVQYEVKPTAEQQPLFDALKTTALADQKNFSDACQAAMGAGGTASATILDRFQNRLAIETAKVTALNDVMPKLKAFYDSLTDAQKQQLQPRRWGGPRMGEMGGPGRWAPPGMMGPMNHMHRPHQPDATPPGADDATPATSDTQG